MEGEEIQGSETPVRYYSVDWFGCGCPFLVMGANRSDALVH
jgi:hypothetical protein